MSPNSYPAPPATSKTFIAVATLLVAMIGQALMVVWYGGNLSSEYEAGISSNRKDIARIEGELNVMRTSAQQQAIQLARIEENIRNLTDAVTSLNRNLERQQQGNQ